MTKKESFQNVRAYLEGKRIEAEERISHLIEMAKLNQKIFGFEEEVLTSTSDLELIEFAFKRLNASCYDRCSICNNKIDNKLLLEWPYIHQCRNCLKHSKAELDKITKDTAQA